MPGCRNDADPRPGFGLAVDLLEPRAHEFGDVRQVGVVGVGSRMRELAPLHEDRRVREMVVAAGVIGMEVAVRDELHVRRRVSAGAERFGDGSHLDRREAFDELLGLRAETGVEEEDAAGVLDDERGHDDPLAWKAAVRRHCVVPGVDRLDAGKGAPHRRTH